MHAPSFSASPRLRRTVQVCQMRRAARRACSSPATSAAAAMSAEPRSVRPTSASASSSRLPPRAPPCHPTLTLTRRCSCAKQRLRPHARTARRPSTTPFARSQRLAHSVRSSGAVRQKRDGGGPGARHVQPRRSTAKRVRAAHPAHGSSSAGARAPPPPPASSPPAMTDTEPASRSTTMTPSRSRPASVLTHMPMRKGIGAVRYSCAARVCFYCLQGSAARAHMHASTSSVTSRPCRRDK